jgi:hypothetical protein
MLGFMTAPEAKLEFLKNYDSPGHFQSMETIPFEEFRERVLDGDGKGKKIEAYGTSEGVKKEWDTRGRGRKKVFSKALRDAADEAADNESEGMSFKQMETGEHLKRAYDHAYSYADQAGVDVEDLRSALESIYHFSRKAFDDEIKASVGISIGDQVVVDGINYRWVVKGFKGKLLVLEKKGQFNEQQPRTILRTMRQVTKI